MRIKSIEVLAKGMKTLRGKPSDSATARERYQSLAAEGDTDAMTNLGNLLLDQGDLPAARHWYQKAAAAGHAVAMYNLGLVAQFWDPWTCLPRGPGTRRPLTPVTPTP